MWVLAFRQTANVPLLPSRLATILEPDVETVVLKDTLDTTLVTPILKNNVYVDGVLNNKWSFANKVFTLELGDIAPNEKRVVKITVEFKTDAGGKTYTNLVAATVTMELRFGPFAGD